MGVKTMMVAEFLFPTAQAIPQAQRDYVYNMRKPPPIMKTWVWAYVGTSYVISLAHQRVRFNRPLPPAIKTYVETPTADDLDGYFSTFSVGHLGFQVFGFVRPKLIAPEDGRWVEVIQQIWPSLSLSIEWPPKQAIGNDDVLEQFSTRL